MDLISRFTGCLMGQALGDALGAPFEGGPLSKKSPLNRLILKPPAVLMYTDDTEMAIGVAESLASRGGLDQEDMAQRFVKNFNPFRGYGPGTIHVLNLIGRGTPWQTANRMVFPDGSFGNGAAMRAAPLGLFFLRNQYKLKEATYGASAITHDHPLAKEGALIITFSVASALKDESNEKLLETLAGIVRLPEYKLKLDSIRSLLGTEASAEDIVDELGNTVEALESVPAALYAFLKYGDDFMKTVGFCISMGGDTDTISAMAGSLSGARVGLEGLPGELTSRLEDREKLGDLAKALYESAMKASA